MTGKEGAVGRLVDDGGLLEALALAVAARDAL